MIRVSTLLLSALTLCLFALAPFVLSLICQRRFALAAACTALMLGFFANMMFASNESARSH